MTIFNNPRFQALDDAGISVSGARLYFFAKGTTTKLDTFQDEAMTIKNSNPVVADSSGRFPAILLQPLEYSVRFTINVDGVEEEVWDQDVSGVIVPIASDTEAGIVELATPAEMAAGLAEDRVPSVKVVTDFIALDGARITSGTVASDRLPDATTEVDGVVELATQTEMDNGTPGVVPTADLISNFVNNQPGVISGFNGANPGHIEFSNGLIINFGSGTVGANTSTTATYDQPYTMFSIPVTSGGTGATTNDPGATASGATTTGFTVTNSTGSSITYYYVAIGV